MKKCMGPILDEMFFDEGRFTGADYSESSTES